MGIEYENDTLYVPLHIDMQDTLPESYDNTTYQELVEAFTQKNKSFPEVNSVRCNIISDIKNQLSKCRELDSWDDRSEIKLYGVLLGYIEIELDLLSLSELSEIKEKCRWIL